MNSIQNGFLRLPLPLAARQTAEEFAIEQPTPQKAEQVCLNTLAVWAVNEYLQLMGISTNMTGGDSWNPIVRLCANVADLEIIGLGRLECRPLKAQELTCSIPAEVWEDRIGYVVVQIDESLRDAVLLGFTPAIAVEEISLTQLQPLEELLAYLHQLRQSTSDTQSAIENIPVNLSRWIKGIFETDWLLLEDLLYSSGFSPAFSFRSTETSILAQSNQSDERIRRAKLLNLENQQENHSVALIVVLNPEANQHFEIWLRVFPIPTQVYLPPNLQLMVFDESDTVFLEAQSRTTDNYIQLHFRGQLGDRFQVKVVYGDTFITEDFII